MKNIELYLEDSFVSKEDMEKIKPQIMNSQKMLLEKKGISSEMTGWIDYTTQYDKEEYEEIKSAAQCIKNNSQAFILLGIGGSYLGPRAAIEAIRGDFHNQLCSPEVYYAGQNLSGTYLKNLIKVIKDKEVSVIVISKSGTTLETAAAFRIIRNIMIEKYKDKAKERIFVVTDKKKGALKKLSDIYNYKAFKIPDNIGGRYSIITPVGLLPMAAAGLNIDKFIEGLRSAEKEYQVEDFEKNICCQYAATRNILNQRGKEIEILVGYEPSQTSIGEWWKQLFGESEGKCNKGIFPASLNFTTDLHSMGQYVQEGKKIIFETTIVTESCKNDIVMVTDDNDFDKLNYLRDKTFNYINNKAYEGTFQAHKEGSVSGIVIKIPRMDEFYLSKLLYFFMMSCAISGYTLDIDPFTQPGVEAYKKNMFKLLGKI